MTPYKRLPERLRNFRDQTSSKNVPCNIDKYLMKYLKISFSRSLDQGLHFILYEFIQTSSSSLI